MLSKFQPTTAPLVSELTGAASLAHLRDINTKREELFAQLRGAKNWESVASILQAQGFSLIYNDGEPFVANFTAQQLFPLSDCGHSMLVFSERLGPYPAGQTAE